MTYVLGYYPSHGQWGGKFREIQVQVKRSGLRLRYRRGYHALADAPVDVENSGGPCWAALGSPRDATSLGLNVHILPVVPGARTLKTELQTSPRDITLDPQGDRWVGALDLLFVQLAPDGSTMTGETKTLNMRLSQQTYAEVLKDGVTVTRNLPAVEGAAKLRIVVRDANSGAIGSISVPLGKLFPSSGS